MAEFKFFNQEPIKANLGEQTFGEHVYYAYRVRPVDVSGIPSFEFTYMLAYHPATHDVTGDSDLQDVLSNISDVANSSDIGVDKVLEAQGYTLSGEPYDTYVDLEDQSGKIRQQLEGSKPYTLVPTSPTFSRDDEGPIPLRFAQRQEDPIQELTYTDPASIQATAEEFTRAVTFTVSQNILMNFPTIAASPRNAYQAFVDLVLLEAGSEGLKPRMSGGEPVTKEQAEDFLSENFPLLTVANIRKSYSAKRFTPENPVFQLPASLIRGITTKGQLQDYIKYNFGTEGPVDPTIPVEDRARSLQEQQEAQQAENERIAKLRSKVKFTEQALLLKNLKHFAKKSIGFREAFPYDNFACLDAKEQNSISDFVTFMTTQNNMAGLFSRLKPIHISSMIPVVRVYGYEDKKKDKVYEYEFEEFSSLPTEKDLLGTSTGVNLTSFSWNFRGETPYLADKKIDCQMTLRAQSVDALVASRRSKGIKYNFSNLFLPVQPGQTKNGSLIGETDSEVRKMRNRVTVRYSIDRSVAPWSSDSALADMVESMSVDLELSLVSHSIDLNQDGTMKVNINFIGRYDAEVKEPDNSNILSRDTLPEEQEEGMSLIGGQTDATRHYKILELREEIKKLENLDGKQAEAREQLKTELRALENPAPEKETSDFDRKRGVLNLMKKIYEKRGVKVARVDVETLDVVAATQEEIEQEQSLPGRGTGQTVEESIPTDGEMGTNQLQTVSDLKQSLMRDVDLFVQKIDGFNSRYLNIKYLFLGDILEAALESYAENANSENHDDHVRDLRVILGPIEFYSGFYDSSTGESFTPTYNGMTGDFDNPAVLTRCQNLQEKKNKSDEEKKELEACKKELENIKPIRVSCNIADIPVSVNLLSSWLTENILEEGKAKMTFDDFIKSITSRLIPQLIQTEAENALLPRVNSKVFDSVHSAPTDEAKPFADGIGFLMEKNEKSNLKTPMWKPFRGGDFRPELAGRERKRVYIEDLKSGKKPGVPLPNRASSPESHMADYLMIYGEPLEQEKPFDKQRDQAQGIYHLQVGQDAGVVKEINLSVVEDQSFESFVIFKALQKGSNVRKRFYDATVEMQGVTFFRPGQKVFINPAAFGRPEDLKSFGLLAYYTVITSENVIEDGQYKTSLACKFHAYPSDRGGNS